MRESLSIDVINGSRHRILEAIGWPWRSCARGTPQPALAADSPGAAGPVSATLSCASAAGTIAPCAPARAARGGYGLAVRPVGGRASAAAPRSTRRHGHGANHHAGMHAPGSAGEVSRRARHDGARMPSVPGADPWPTVRIAHIGESGTRNGIAPIASGDCPRCIGASHGAAAGRRNSAVRDRPRVRTPVSCSASTSRMSAMRPSPIRLAPA